MGPFGPLGLTPFAPIASVPRPFSPVNVNQGTDSTSVNNGLTPADNQEWERWLSSIGIQQENQKELMDLSMAFNADQAALSRQYSALENEKLRAWQEQMQGSYFQRTVEDMKKAGLNPSMMYGSYSGGSSAISSATNTGASASVNTPGAGNGQGFSFEGAINSAYSGIGAITKILGVLAIVGKLLH